MRKAGCGYDPRLDGVRAFAVFSVMYFHTGLMIPGGLLGVDVFFVLSGYLITTILRRELEATGTIEIGDFLWSRARRLVPALAALLTVYVLLAPVLIPAFSRARWFDAISAALYVSNWREAMWFSAGPLSHTWSLSVEGQFYLVWPLVLMCLRPLGAERAGALLFGAWGALTAARIAWLGAGHDEWFAYFATLFHASGLVLGSALALRPIKLKHGALAFLVLLALAQVPHNRETFSWALPASELAAAALVAAPPAWLGWRPLAWLGKISYGVYLWHIPVWHALGREMNPPSLIALAVISVALATLSHYGLERRFTQGRSTGRSRWRLLHERNRSEDNRRRRIGWAVFRRPCSGARSSAALEVQ